MGAVALVLKDHICSKCEFATCKIASSMTENWLSFYASRI
jgi:hypothetical protein